MSEEKKESKSHLLQLRIPSELKEKLEEKAKNAGVSLNQYILFLMIKDVKDT